MIDRMRRLFMVSSQSPTIENAFLRLSRQTRRKDGYRQVGAKAIAFAVLLGAHALLGVGVTMSVAQDIAPRAEIWDLSLGMDIRSVPRLDYQDYACGSNGGPAGLPLVSFADFRSCRPEPDGLYEVQFRYDDEAEFVARAYEAQALIERFEGTRPFGHPSVISALIDAEGILRGLRVVTDDRVSDDQRMGAFAFSRVYRIRFGEEGFDCIEGEPSETKMPVGNAFADARCIKHTEEMTIVVVSEFYRRPGQFAIDPVSGRLTSGEFTSSARLEMYQRGFGPEF